MPQFFSKLLWPLWAISFALCATLLTLIIRDQQNPLQNGGDTAIVLNVAAPGQWQSSRFHVARAGRYQLQLSSSNHSNARAGRYLIADIEVAVIAPGDTPVFQQYYSGESIGHRVPASEENTHLRELDLSPEDEQEEPWTLKARVFSPDPNFRGVNTELRLQAPADTGFLAVAPKWLAAAMAAALVALITAWRLTRRKRWIPMAATGLCTLLLLVFSLGLVPTGIL